MGIAKVTKGWTASSSRPSATRAGESRRAGPSERGAMASMGRTRVARRMGQMAASSAPP